MDMRDHCVCHSYGVQMTHDFESVKIARRVEYIDAYGLDELIFVFGSNLLGHHGAGAALHAMRHWDAEYGVGIGRTGQSWAIPTKDEHINTLPLTAIEWYVHAFLAYAYKRKTLEFQVTAIGCGLAGYHKGEIAPMFAGAPLNCHLPIGWRD